jgi:hypothetical protein
MIMCSNDSKILKMQMKFENYEICQYLMISHVRDIVKIEWVLNILSCMMLTNRYMCEEVS